MSDRFHFHRFEFKYLIDNRYRNDLIKDLLYYMDFDIPTKNGRSSYEVLNLYIDSPSLKFYRQKVDGLMFRKKILHISALKPKGYKILLEVLVKCDYDKDKVVEVPFVFAERRYGYSKLGFKVSLDYIRHVVSLYFYKLFR